jgi:hypothetical protein
MYIRIEEYPWHFLKIGAYGKNLLFLSLGCHEFRLEMVRNYSKSF